jgi:hypothetical protein
VRLRAGGTNSTLGGVSCSAARACAATGNVIIKGHNNAFSERWNGRTWTIETTPNHKDGVNGDFLSGVACGSRLACTAVGGYDSQSGQEGTLAEAWHGRNWAIKAVPHPAGASFTNLDGVSCRAKNACVAVGFEFNSSAAEAPVAEAWNGKAWTIKRVPV